MTPASRKRAAGKSGPEQPAEPEQPADTPRASKRVPRSLYLDEELLERARAAVHELAAFHPDSGVRSLSDIFEPAAWTEVQRLEKEFNNGKPFRPLIERMPGGRPQRG